MHSLVGVRLFEHSSDGCIDLCLAAGGVCKCGAAHLTVHIGGCFVEDHLGVLAIIALHLEELALRHRDSGFDRHILHSLCSVMWGSGLVHLDKFELVRSPADNVVCLAAALAPVPEMHAPGGFLTPLGLWPGETSIPGGDLAESPLAPFEFGGTLLLDPFHVVISVMLTVRAICLN